MRRRDFIKAVLASGAALGVGALGTGAFVEQPVLGSRPRISVADLLRLSWAYIVKGHPSHVHRHPQVTITDFDIRTYRSQRVERLQVPICWTENEERAQITENQLVSLTANLADNALHSHDALMGDLIERSAHVFVSKSCNYQLGDVFKFKGYYMVMMQTAVYTLHFNRLSV